MTAPSRPTPASPLPARAPAALAGSIAAACALATGELVAGLVRDVPSSLASVGSTVIDMAPPGSKEVVVSLFGTNDKAALLVMVTVVVLLAGAGIGLLARSRRMEAAVVVGTIAAVGAVASLRNPAASLPLVVVAAVLQAGIGIQSLFLLLASATGSGAAAGPVAAAPPASPAPADSRRRGFLQRAGVLGAFAVLGGGVGRSLLDGRAAATARSSTQGGSSTDAAIPQAVDPAPTPPPDASFPIDGLTPLVVPNDAFYRIDTAILTPSVDITGWTLRVHGMVNRELNLSFHDLVSLPLIERYVTISCVSNEVGGNLVGNAKWTGPRLKDVLDLAGVQAGATQVVPRSLDGWTAGFPTAWITDPAHPRDAMIAVKMNDDPLPVDHGFPARLIVPGLYGYVSATKWLGDIQLTTLEAFDAYWVPRGWAKEGPILTQSRIDVPGNGASIKAGRTVVAGVAWAPDRGIEKVELSVDRGDWQTATLATELSKATWVQWKWTWQATPGEHVLEVRATDGTGDVQTADFTPPNPDGARGHHRITVLVA